jgi:fructoselysine-6-P-deglycase FrlB-like protein
MKVNFFINQLLVCYLNPIYEETINFLKNIHFRLKEVLPVFQEQAKKIAEVLHKHESIFVLGKGFGEAIAK